MVIRELGSECSLAITIGHYLCLQYFSLSLSHTHTHTHTHTHLLDSLSLLRHVFFCQVFIIQLQWNDIGSS